MLDGLKEILGDFLWIIDVYLFLVLLHGTSRWLRVVGGLWMISLNGKEQWVPRNWPLCCFWTDQVSTFSTTTTTPMPAFAFNGQRMVSLTNMTAGLTCNSMNDHILVKCHSFLAVKLASFFDCNPAEILFKVLPLLWRNKVKYLLWNMTFCNARHTPATRDAKLCMHTPNLHDKTNQDKFGAHSQDIPRAQLGSSSKQWCYQASENMHDSAYLVRLKAYEVADWCSVNLCIMNELPVIQDTKKSNSTSFVYRMIDILPVTVVSFMLVPHCILNSKTMNSKSMMQTKYEQLEIMCPEFDRDLMDALANSDFVNNVNKMEREISWSEW